MSFPVSSEIEHFFKILQQPPRWPFLGEKFVVELSIVNRDDVIVEGCEMPFKIELMYENGEKVHDQSVFTCEREFPSTSSRGKGASQKQIMEIPRSGTLKFWVGINELSASPRHHGQPSFCLRFSSLNDRFAIFPVVSTQLTCVRYALSISLQPPREFFKDEGGRDKSITMNAELVDRRGVLVAGKEVLLKAVLLYESDGQEVQKQSILRYLSDFPKSIDKTGHAILRFRIEEVSKNHQAQAFCIRLEPDYDQSPENREIAAVVTTPITVLSKRNKRKKPRPHNADALLAITAGFPQQTKQPAERLFIREPPAQFQPNKKQQQQAPGKSHKALEEVVTWCQYVSKGLQDLEWQQVGYEPLNQHMTNPIFRCPACWVYKGARPVRHQPMCMIAQALQVYHHKLLPQFQELDAILKTAETSSEEEGPDSPPSGGTNFYRQQSLEMPFHPVLTSSCSVEMLPPGNPVFGNQFLASGDGMSMSLNSLSHLADADSFGLSDEEDQVYTILVVLSSLGGFPAFDSAGKLVGIYQLQTATNQLEFLSKRSFREKEDQISESEALLLTYQRNRSPLVVSKTDCVNLERTKEQASLVYFQHKNGSH